MALLSNALGVARRRDPRRAGRNGLLGGAGLVGLILVASVTPSAELGASTLPPALAAGSGSSSAPVKSSCPDVAIYGVRGSSQDYAANELGMGPETYALSQEIQRRLPSTLRILEIGVPYPASSPLEASFNQYAGDLSPYNHSVSSGVSLLLHGRSDFETPGALIKRCPSAAVVLAGISQGAQVITMALAQDGANSDLVKHVAAVLLYASPIRVSGQSINVGAQNEDGVLANPASSQPGGQAALIPNSLYDRTRSYCLQDDPVCDNTNIRFEVSARGMIHTSYAKSLFTLQAADFAVGRIWAARQAPPQDVGVSQAPQDYVAIGDSYASGEGANDYFDGTQSGDDTCHRSALADSSLLGAPKSQFVACSGATVNDIENSYKTEQPQLNALNSSVDLVTVSAGGDDAGFSGVITNCTDIPILNGKGDSDCRGAIDSAEQNFPQIQKNLESLYQKIHTAAPHARIMAIGYPQLWPTGGYSGGCNHMHQDWQQWLNDAGTALNRVIQQAVKDSANTEFVDTTTAFKGHEVCGRPDDATEYVNDLQLHCPGGNGSSHFLICSESYHPTPAGYIVLRDRVFDQLDHDLVRKPANPSQGSSSGAGTCGVAQLQAVIRSYFNGTPDLPSNTYAIGDIKTAGTHPTWASFELLATSASQSHFQNTQAVARCDTSWKVKGYGTSMVGCGTVPSSLLRPLGLTCSAQGAGKAVSPGHGSPEAAVEGYFSSVLAGRNAAACGYLVPSFQSTCEAFSASEGSSTGSFSIAGDAVRGAQALVSVTGRICQSGSCGSNSDGSTGMPSPNGSFSAAYQEAIAAAGNSSVFVLSPVPCIETGGQWYVNFSLGGGSGSNSGTTGGTGNTGTAGGTGNTGSSNTGTTG